MNDSTGEVETPESWLYWSFIACISAAAGNNYYTTTMSGNVVYKPNLYIILMGESGLGKAFPISRAKHLITQAAVTRVIAGRSSIQAIVQELSRTKTVEGKSPISDSRGFVINGELGSAFIADPQALHIMTDLFDGRDNPEWVNLLKGDGPERLKFPYITSLFGANPSVFYASIPPDNITGGYIGRTLIVYEEKRSKELDLFSDKDDLIEVDKFNDIIAPKYVPHLQNIASKKGKLILTSSARDFINTWRRKWRLNQAKDTTGFLNRVPEHVMKVAMCLALARYDYDGIITELEIEEAIQKVTMLIYNSKKAAEGGTRDPVAVISKSVLDLLIAAPCNKLTRKKLLQKGYGMFHSLSLDSSIENLLEMGWVRKHKVGIGKEMDWEIELWGEPLESYQKYMKEKNK